jgi:UDP-N-acetylmuramoyl-L-alanyl-D-glutamate--2,6-diaminopimelate ligase
MVLLSDLVGTLGGACTPLRAGGDCEVRDVHLDSRRAEAGTLFAALPGGTADGADFAPQALDRGAVAILSPRRLDPLLAERGDQGTWANWVHPEARRIAGAAAAMVYGHPARRLSTIGITGTNGKSTVAHLIAELLEHGGRRPTVAGTVEVRPWGAASRPATHTTPDACELQRLSRETERNGGDCLVLEVSSHALDQERIAGLDLDVAVFTNLSRDHLDYHRDMDTYAEAKEKIFAHLRDGGTAVINADDPSAERMAKAAHRSAVTVVMTGTGPRAGLIASRIEVDPQGTHLFLEGMGIPLTGLLLPLVGRFNVENALAASAAVLSLGASPSRVLEGLATISPPRGRLEAVELGASGSRVFVDYAHTPQALERVLCTLRGILEDEGEGGKLVVVFGCGGDRDREKRPQMGRIAGAVADVAVVTSDNPRNEDPEAIIDDVLSGMSGARAEVRAEVDRRLAIRDALKNTSRGDVVLVAGKGHETWQQLRGRREPFDDRTVVREEVP